MLTRCSIWASPGQCHHAPVVRRMIGDVRELSQCFAKASGHLKHALTISPDVLSRSTSRFRHIGDTSAMFSPCSCKHRRCIFDVIIIAADLGYSSPVIHELLCEASVMLWRCYRLCALHPVIRQQNKSNLYFIHDLTSIAEFNSTSLTVSRGSTD